MNWEIRKVKRAYVVTSGMAPVLYVFHPKKTMALYMANDIWRNLELGEPISWINDGEQFEDLIRFTDGSWIMAAGPRKNGEEDKSPRAIDMRLNLLGALRDGSFA